jgi:hypothetical protein
MISFSFIEDRQLYTTLLQNLIVGNGISVRFFLENRVEAICGMEKTRQEGRG